MALPRFPPTRIPALPPPAGRYRLAFAHSEDDLDAVLRLRFEVFNLELEEGLSASHETGRDHDAFDAQCDHLLLRDTASGLVVGTYRMQTWDMARKGAGFYSATEFELADLPEGILRASLEIGRACIARDHRSLKTLYLLWQGLGRYVAHNRSRYVFGCCSLTSQDPHEATRVYRRLRTEGHVEERLSVRPHPTHRCLVEDPVPGPDAVPRLMRAYLSLGARICSEPAIDREFGTVDYVALFDVSRMEASRLAFYKAV